MPTDDSSSPRKIFHVPWIHFHRPPTSVKSQNAPNLPHKSILLIFPDDPDTSAILITEDPSGESEQHPCATITFPAYNPTNEDTVSDSVKLIEALGLGENGIRKPTEDSMDVNWDRSMKVCIGDGEAKRSWVWATGHSNGKAGVSFHTGETTNRGLYLSVSFQPPGDDSSQALIEAWSVKSAPPSEAEKRFETRY